MCYYCSCQMRLLENLYWKNVNLQKKFLFFPVKLKNCNNLGELFLWNGKHKFEMILEKNSCCYLLFSENMNHLIVFETLANYFRYLSRQKTCKKCKISWIHFSQLILEIMHCTISWMCARSTNYNTQIIAEKVKVGT